MNKKPTPKQESIFHKRGFYIALYSCVAVLLVTAAAITYSSLREEGSQNKIADNYAEANSKNVLPEKSNPTASKKEDVENNVKVELKESSSLPNSESAAAPKVAQAPSANEATPKKSFIDENPSAPASSTSNEPSVEASAQQVKPLGIIELKPVENPEASVPAKEEETKPASSSTDTKYTEMLADPVFKTYDGESDMLWPVSGSIVMNYSVDKVIYDVTLDQYRTNDNICISGSVGQAVVAAADGVVVDISSTRENGNTIVVEHGNGWSTTYSQLQSDMLVSVGDVITAGQEIGYISNPSIYSVLLGNHLEFKVVKDNETIDPKMILVQKQ